MFTGNLLGNIPFPSLPTLLLSAGDLANLYLRNIPPSGYIPPETMVMGLAALPRPEHFSIGFQSATPRPGQIHPPPMTRAIPPALTSFSFKGASEYLEDLVSRIDAPPLDEIHIYYLHQVVDFQVRKLSRFVEGSVGPKLALFKYANVTFFCDKATFDTSHQPHDPYSDTPCANTTIFFQEIGWQGSHIAQVLSQCSARLSNVVHLKLDVHLEEDSQLEGTDDVEWLHLLHQFSTMQALSVLRELVGNVALVLEEITAEMVADTLPSLDLI